MQEICGNVMCLLSIRRIIDVHCWGMNQHMYMRFLIRLTIFIIVIKYQKKMVEKGVYLNRFRI